jgi:hypothetical protein
LKPLQKKERPTLFRIVVVVRVQTRDRDWHSRRNNFTSQSPAKQRLKLRKLLRAPRPGQASEQACLPVATMNHWTWRLSSIFLIRGGGNFAEPRLVSGHVDALWLTSSAFIAQDGSWLASCLHMRRPPLLRLRSATYKPGHIT